MGPRNAAKQFGKSHPEAARFEVTLYGALAATGKGHLTDKAILDVLTKIAPTEIVWQPDIFLPFHPNGMTLRAFDAEGKILGEITKYSVGGGDVVEEGAERRSSEDVYDMHTISDILKWCDSTGHSFWEYVEKCEDASIWDYLREVWQVMKEAVDRGI